MKIRVIFPGVKSDFHTQKDMNVFNSDDCKIDIVNANIGPETVTCRTELSLTIPGTLEQIIRAEKDGIDAVVIDCMGDVAVDQGRELVKIPVIGPFRTAMHVAGTLGDKFAIITVDETANHVMRQQARMYNLENKLAAVLSIGIPPADLQTSLEKTINATEKAALNAVENYHADTIIFGCCGMMGCGINLKQFLLDHGHDVVILDPLPLAIQYAKMLVASKLSHSKKFYGTHSMKNYKGFEFLI